MSKLKSTVTIELDDDKVIEFFEHIIRRDLGSLRYLINSIDNSEGKYNVQGYKKLIDAMSEVIEYYYGS